MSAIVQQEHIQLQQAALLEIPIVMGSVAVKVSADDAAVSSAAGGGGGNGTSGSGAGAGTLVMDTQSTGRKGKTHTFYVYVGPRHMLAHDVIAEGDAASSNATGGCGSDGATDSLLLASHRSAVTSRQQLEARLFYELVDRVEFVLDVSFGQPRRVVRNPPFIIRESAWGESFVNIIVFFRRTSSSPAAGSSALLGAKRKRSGGDANDDSTTDDPSSLRRAAMPLLTSKASKSLIAHNQLQTGGAGTASSTERLLFAVPIIDKDTISKLKESNQHAANSDANGDDELDMDGSSSSLLMTSEEVAAHKAAMASCLVTRHLIRLHQPVVNATDHPALCSLRFTADRPYQHTPLAPISVATAVDSDAAAGGNGSGPLTPAMLHGPIKARDDAMVGRILRVSGPEASANPLAYIENVDRTMVFTADNNSGGGGGNAASASARDRAATIHDASTYCGPHIPVVSQRNDFVGVFCAVPNSLSAANSSSSAVNSAVVSSNLLRWYSENISQWSPRRGSASTSSSSFPSSPQLPCAIQRLIAKGVEAARTAFIAVNKGLTSPLTSASPTPAAALRSPMITGAGRANVAPIDVDGGGFADSSSSSPLDDLAASGVCQSAPYLAMLAARLMMEEQSLLLQLHAVEAMTRDVWLATAHEQLAAIGDRLSEEMGVDVGALSSE